MRKPTGFYSGDQPLPTVVVGFYEGPPELATVQVATSVTHAPSPECASGLPHWLQDCGCYHDADVAIYTGEDGQGWT